jgi:monofunctional biosynthetic peptidoglycan transglycosylase
LNVAADQRIAKRKASRPPSGRKKKWLRKIVMGGALLVLALYAWCALCVVALRWIDPVTTAVQMERRVGALLKGKPYHKRYEFVPLRRISPNLQHAVVAAEDGRFRTHHGFDWIEMQKVLEKDIERHKLGRGGSTITQQLVKNLFLSTERSLLRKGVEFTLVPMVETLLTKDRILELYLNVIEWGPGIYGAEAASQFYYHTPARELTREQAARLAAIIPAPLKRKPAQMNEYSAEILDRMVKTGW